MLVVCIVISTGLMDALSKQLPVALSLHIVAYFASGGLASELLRLFSEYILMFTY